MKTFLVDPVGIEPTISSLQMRCSTTKLQAPARLWREFLIFNFQFLNRSKVVGVEGIEPSTSFLSGMRSTTEPHAQGDEVNFIFRLRYARQTNNSFFIGKLFILFLKIAFNPNSLKIFSHSFSNLKEV